jgi:hypothetical protein
LINSVVAPFEEGTPRYHTSKWATAFTPSPSSGFTPLERSIFSHSQRGPRSMVHNRILSVSFIGKLDARGKKRVVDSIDAYIDATWPSSMADDNHIFTLPYTTDIFIATRLP